MSRYVLLDTQDDGGFGTWIDGPNKNGMLLVDGYLKLVVKADSLAAIATHIGVARSEVTRGWAERLRLEEEGDGPCCHYKGGWE